MNGPARLALLARDLLLASLAVAVAAPLWLLPWNASAAVARLLGTLAWLCWPSARRIAAINLRRAHGTAMTRARARRLSHRVVRSLAQGIAEGLQFARRHASGDAWQELYEAEDPALERRLLEDPRPKVFAAGHLGSWEVAALMAGRRAGARGAAVMRRVDNPFLDALVRRVRGRVDAGLIEKRGALSEALSRLRSGGSVLLLLDENAGSRGVLVPYFGRPASTSRSAALLALATGSPVVVGAAVRRGPRRFLYRLALLEPPPATRPDPEAVRALTAEIVAVWERWVRDDPDQWRWIHHRWKTRPDGTEERYRPGDLRRAFAGEEAV